MDKYRARRIDLAELEQHVVAWQIAHPQDAALVEELMGALRSETDGNPAKPTIQGGILKPTGTIRLHPSGTSDRTDSTPVKAPAPGSSVTPESEPSEILQSPEHPSNSEMMTRVASPPNRIFREPHEGDILKNRFVLEKLIGRGGMGAVFKARDLRKEEARDREPFVAVKVLSGDIRNYPDAFIALQREAKKAQKLAHPNIVIVYDFDRDGGTAYMTMELLEGESLADIIRRHPHGLPLKEALPIIRGIVEGLDYAHRQGIVHADLKPSNVYVTRSGVVKVLDFGIARVLRKPAGAL
ncbi:serine/threonine protein kinase, partial [Candidatus Parcubacteria bacterium]